MKYGLIGKTLVHSYSKEIHESLGKYEYNLFSLEANQLNDFINTRDFNGLNVTIPYKQDVIPLCDEVSQLASSIGAVNTLYWDRGAEDGKARLIGHNTDYEGLLYTASRSSIEFDKKTVLILGTGGTSLMAQKLASDQGAKTVYVATRKKSVGASQVTTLAYDELESIAESIEVIVNTTPVGTFPNNLESVISLDDFPRCEAVIDVIYNPFKTKLLLDAERAGLKTANGLPMLVAQATAAAGYFLGTPDAFRHENEAIIKSLTKQMQNIVLIGMPGCGKTSIGKILSEMTGKTFVDLDDEIVKKAGKSIPEIFAESGEEGFRDIESSITQEFGKSKGLIIATGGGCILRQKNVDALRQNGRLVHIRRPLNLLATGGRPLSRNISALEEMEKTRLPLYEAASEFTFENLDKKSLKVLADEIYLWYDK